ncbi:MAG: SPFH domain-containing protein [Eubacteriales bacterium]|nr:SPFH domain-containing protein [Eubacteriales bacterium]
MGLIKAIGSAAGSVLADQWKEYFYCDAMGADVLLTRGQKRLSEKRGSSNTKGEDNIISNGSVIAVADGQCMVIVEQGKVMELCAEPGEFTWDASSEPSIFAGSLGESVKQTFANIGRRFTFGGDAPKDQRVYYINTKEIPGNRYGTPAPVPFRVVDANVGLDIDISVRCNGEYSYRITDPILFYTNVCGNVTQEYQRGQIDSQLKAELMTALQPAFARISAMGVRYSAVPAHTQEMADALNEELSDKWAQLRGIRIVSFGINTIKASQEDEDMIKELQRAGALRSPAMAAATLTQAQAEAMKSAAANPNAGPMMAFAGMNMAAGAGGLNAGELYRMAAQEQAAAQQSAAHPSAQAASAQGQPAESAQQGAPMQGQPAEPVQQAAPAQSPQAVWICPKCHAENKGNFCGNCGQKRPAEGCAHCGYAFENPANPPKFCPNCGQPV